MKIRINVLDTVKKRSDFIGELISMMLCINRDQNHVVNYTYIVSSISDKQTRQFKQRN